MHQMLQLEIQEDLVNIWQQHRHVSNRISFVIEQQMQPLNHEVEHTYTADLWHHKPKQKIKFYIAGKYNTILGKLDHDANGLYYYIDGLSSREGVGLGFTGGFIAGALKKFSCRYNNCLVLIGA